MSLCRVLVFLYHSSFGDSVKARHNPVELSPYHWVSLSLTCLVLQLHLRLCGSSPSQFIHVFASIEIFNLKYAYTVRFSCKTKDLKIQSCALNDLLSLWIHFTIRKHYTQSVQNEGHLFLASMTSVLPNITELKPEARANRVRTILTMFQYTPMASLIPMLSNTENMGISLHYGHRSSNSSLHHFEIHDSNTISLFPG